MTDVDTCPDCDGIGCALCGYLGWVQPRPTSVTEMTYSEALNLIYEWAWKPSPPDHQATRNLIEAFDLLKELL